MAVPEALAEALIKHHSLKITRCRSAVTLLPTTSIFNATMFPHENNTTIFDGTFKDYSSHVHMATIGKSGIQERRLSHMVMDRLRM